MKTRLLLAVVVALFMSFLFGNSVARAASDWDFYETWDSGYSLNQWIYSSGSPWSSTSTYSSSYGAHIGNYGSRYKSYPYSCHLGPTPSNYYYNYYDWYLQYEFDSATPGAGTLSFWLYLYYSQFYVQYSSDGTNWTSVSIASSYTYIYGETKKVTIPAGTKYIRFRAYHYSYYYYGAWLDDIDFSVPVMWVDEITGFDDEGVNGDTITFEANAGALSGYTVQQVDFEYYDPAQEDFVWWATDSDGADGWSAALDTLSLGINSPMFKVRAQASGGGTYSSWYVAELNVQNLVISDFWSQNYPLTGDEQISAIFTPPTMNALYPPGPWTFSGSYGYYYTYTEVVNIDDSVPFGGIAKKLHTSWAVVYSTSSSYYYKFKLWKHDGGTKYTVVASTSNISYATGQRTYDLTGSQWSNLPSGLHLGGYFYRGYIYGPPYSGNGSPHNHYYYSSETTTSRDYWYGPSTSFCMPFNVEFEAQGNPAEGAELRYMIGENGDPVDIGEMTKTGSVWTITWPSWAVHSQDVYFEVRMNNGRWCDWRKFGPFEVFNQIDLTFKTKLGETDPGPGTLVVDGESYASPATLTYLYYQDINVTAPQYVFDSNNKRWRWNSWSDNGDRSHVITTEPYMGTTFTASYIRQYSYFVDSIRPNFSGTQQGWYDWGTSIELNIERFSIETEGQERFECKGWSIPALNLSGTVLDVLFDLTTDVVVYLTWQRQFYFISYNDFNSGVGNLPGWYPEGTTVSYTVAMYIPNGDNARLRCGGYTIGESLTPDVNSLTFQIAAFTEVYWTWAQQFYLIAITNTGSIAPENGWYDEGTEVYIYSTPPVSDDRIRYTFVRWDGQGAGAVDREGGEPEVNVTVNSPIIERAIWLIEYHLVLASNLGGFSPDVSGWYPPMTEVNVNAVAPNAQSGSRYLPEWVSDDEAGINEGPMEDTPVAATITMSTPVFQNVNWHLQHRLTVAVSEDLGYQFPAVGDYWYFDGTMVEGFCKFLSGSKVCSGFVGTGSYQSSADPFFRGEITAPSTVTWNFRDRELLPTFGIEPPDVLDSMGPMAFATDLEGRPCVAYLNTSLQVVFGVYNGTEWNTNIVDTVSSPFTFISLTMKGNEPFIVRDDRDSLNLVAYGNWPEQYTAGGIGSVEFEYEGDSAINPNAAFDFVNEILYVSAFSASGDLLLYSYDGEEMTVEVVDSQGIPGYFNDICVSPVTGSPFILYQDAFDRALKMAYRNGGEWLFEVVDNQGNVGVDVRCEAGRSGDIYVAYRNATYVDKSFVKFAVRDPQGWRLYTLDATGNVGRGLSLALGSDEYPHIAYYGSNFLRLLRNIGSGWEVYTLVGNIQPTGMTSVTVAPDNRPVISFGDDGAYKVVYGVEGYLRPDNYSEGEGGGIINPWPTTGSGGGGGCFIATAAFGSMAQSSVSALTYWRSSVLEASDCGRDLRDLYYAVSPAIAASEESSIAALLRSLLK
ncbi:MAG: hypothetical protein Kow00107_00720 [Planctomycetota bacterium]